MKPSDLYGRWELASFAKRQGNRDIDHPLGPRPTGLLHYTGDGGMAGFLHKDPSQTWTGPLLAAYAGTWELRGDDVHHHVVFNTEPERAGTVLVRRGRIEGDTLVLETLPKGADGASLRIVWRRPR